MKTKTFVLAFIIGLFAVAVWADAGFIGEPSTSGVPVSGGGDYSDIIYYWDCESTTINKGGTTMTMNYYAELVESPSGFGDGTGCVHIPADTGSSSYTTSISLPAAGRMGCYVRYDSAADYATILSLYNNTNDNIQFMQLPMADRIEAVYKADGVQQKINMPGLADGIGEVYFIELAWDPEGTNTVEAYVNGSLIGQNTNALGEFGTTPDTFYIGKTGGHAGEMYIDQVIISNDPTRDLYSIRNRTSFPGAP